MPQADKTKPTPPLPTPPLPPPTPDPKELFKDVYVHGYERVVDGKHEWVHSYWRTQPNGEKPPLTKEKAQKIKDYLDADLKHWQAAEEVDGKDLERFKRALENAHTDEDKYQAEANIEKLSKHLVIDHEAITDINGKLRQL